MSNTVSIDALRPQLWEKELWKDVIDNLFFTNKNLMGTGSDVVIKVKENLKKERGDTITLPLTYKLSGNGTDGDGTLEGNEEAITPYNQNVAIDQKRHAVRLTGKLDEQKNAYDMRMDAKSKLSIWLQEFIEMQFFLKAGGITTTTLTDVNGVTYSANATWSNSPAIVPAADEAAGTGSRYLCADAAGLDSLATTDIMTTDLITRAKVKAQLAAPKIRPIKINGVNHYVMFLHPWQVADLKTNSNSKWYAAQRDAQTRGGTNPIFTGALGIWDNVILYEHEYVPTADAAVAFGVGGTAAGAQAFRSLLMGAEAICLARAGSGGEGWVEETFDYKNKVGFAVGFMGGFQKTAFNSLDYGIISVDTGATDIS